MEKQNQVSNSTHYNRYPRIFKQVKEHAGTNNSVILSFGCSDGSETRCLRDLYFPDSIIYGTDIDEKLLEQNRQNNNDKKIFFCSPLELRKQENLKFDIVFAMSVLCRFPDPEGQYTIANFNETLEQLDSLLKVGGWIVIYNASYKFEDSSVFSKYASFATTFTRGFVPLRDAMWQQKVQKGELSLSNMTDEKDRLPFFFYQKLRE